MVHNVYLFISDSYVPRYFNDFLFRHFNLSSSILSFIVDIITFFLQSRFWLFSDSVSPGNVGFPLLCFRESQFWTHSPVLLQIHEFVKSYFHWFKTSCRVLLQVQEFSLSYFLQILQRSKPPWYSYVERKQRACLANLCWTQSCHIIHRTTFRYAYVIFVSSLF